mmetsp:Transcript_12419/g.26424  ORF Transcript_12419/g.26424 Transcript_12419/m.26424 type:complete len:132 (+) Transcript_12419:31-426(+)
MYDEGKTPKEGPRIKVGRCEGMGGEGRALRARQEGFVSVGHCERARRVCAVVLSQCQCGWIDPTALSSRRVPRARQTMRVGCALRARGEMFRVKQQEVAREASGMMHKNAKKCNEMGIARRSQRGQNNNQR